MQIESTPENFERYSALEVPNEERTVSHVASKEIIDLNKVVWVPEYYIQPKVGIPRTQQVAITINACALRHFASNFN